VTVLTSDVDASPDLGRVARGGVLNLVGAVIYGAASFVLVVIVTNQLGAKGTGEFLLAIAAFNILVKVSELGASTGCVRLISRDLATHREDEVPVLLRVALGPVAVVSTLVATLAWYGASVMGEVVADGSSTAAVADHFRVLTLFLPVATVYSVAVQGTRGFGTMRVQVVVDRIGKPLVQLALVFAALALGAGGTGLDVAWAGPVGLATVPTAVWLRRLVARSVGAHRLPPSRPTREVASEFWRFSAPRALSQVFNIAVLWFDTLLIGALRSAEEAGIYAASTRYLLVGTFTAEAIMQVLGPNISRVLARADVSRAEVLFRAATTWQVCLIWPIYLVVIAFAPLLLGVFGSEFQVAGTALAVLSVGILVSALLGPCDTVVLMAGRSRLSLFNSGMALAVNVAGNLVLTPRWGIEGAAVAWAAALVTFAVLPALQLPRATGIQAFGSSPRVAAAAAVVAVGIPAVTARAIFGPSAAGLALAIGVGGVAATVLGWRLRQRLGLDELVRAFRRSNA
jgi:O-antigen/teichoic acid export membrane protein